MNTSDYAGFVQKLAKPGEQIIMSLSSSKCELLHAAVGVTGEVLEIVDGVKMGNPADPFDHENFVEELGDLEFYLEHYRQVLSIDWVETLIGYDPVTANPSGDLSEDIDFLAAVSGTLLDLTKKHVIYNKALDREKVVTTLAAIEFIMERMRKRVDVSREFIIQKNMEKLAVRYQSLTYSDEAAQRRADKQ